MRLENIKKLENGFGDAVAKDSSYADGYNGIIKARKLRQADSAVAPFSY